MKKAILLLLSTAGLVFVLMAIWNVGGLWLPFLLTGLTVWLVSIFVGGLMFGNLVAETMREEEKRKGIR